MLPTILWSNVAQIFYRVSVFALCKSLFSVTVCKIFYVISLFLCKCLHKRIKSVIFKEYLHLLFLKNLSFIHRILYPLVSLRTVVFPFTTLFIFICNAVMLGKILIKIFDALYNINKMKHVSNHTLQC